MSQDAGTGEWTPVHYFPARSLPAPQDPPHGVTDESLRARRAAAAHARRRRLVAVDLALGLVLALLVLVLAPGVAFVALLAVVGLAACAASLLVGRLRRRG